MSTQNGTTQTHHMFDEQFDALKAGVRKVMDRVAMPPSAQARLRSFADKATETIKAHPYASIGIALGLGYFVVRMVRR